MYEMFLNCVFLSIKCICLHILTKLPPHFHKFFIYLQRPNNKVLDLEKANDKVRTSKQMMIKN